MSLPVISIIMPVFNAAATLDDTLNAVLAQSVREFELIIIDDGSTDDSLSRLKVYAAQDSRIRLVARDNAGVSSARNLGVELGRAPFIAFIDADDIWTADKLECHLACHAAAPNLAASYARIGFLPQEARAMSACRTVSSLSASPLALIDVLGENPVCTMSNLFVRRDWFFKTNGFDVGLSHAEDQDFLAQLLVRGADIRGIDAVLVGYRFSPDGLSMDLDRMRAGWQRVAERHLEGPALSSLQALYARYLARRTLRSGGPALKALSYALGGLKIDAATFLADRRRGLGTLAGVLLAPFLPRALRRQFFA